MPDDRRHSGRVARDVPGVEEVVVVAVGTEAFLLNTLKNPFIRHLEDAATAADVDWDPDGNEIDEEDPAISVLAKNGFSTTIEEEDEDSNDENSNEGSEDTEEDEEDDATGVERDSLELGATGAIGEVKHGLVKLSTGVEGTIASGASKLNRDSSVDGDGSSTTAVLILEGSPSAFGRWGSPTSIVMFLFPFWFTVPVEVSGSLSAADGEDGADDEEAVGWSGSLTADPSDTDGDEGDGDDEESSVVDPGNTQWEDALFGTFGGQRSDGP